MEQDPLIVTDFKSLKRKSANRYSQLSQGLKWLNERAWPLGIGILLTAGMYLFQYIQEEKIPLSITSSAVIAALPAMSAILVFIISMMVAFILMPIFVLFHRLNESGKRLSDDFNFGPPNPELNKLHRSLVLRWGVALLVLGAYCVLVAFVGPDVPHNGWWTAAGVLGLLLTLSAYVWVITFKLSVPVSTEFRLACLMSGFVQVLVILNVSLVVLPIASHYVSNIGWLVPMMIVEVFILWLIQLLGALLVDRMRGHESPVAFVASVVMVLVMLLGFYPPVSAKLGGFALQVSASGGRNCTVMNFAVDNKAIEAIMDPDRRGYSRPLRVIAEVDGIYYVRLWMAETKAVQFVPRASLIAMDVCPSDMSTVKGTVAEVP